jgi:predicted Zn-dependent protease
MWTIHYYQGRALVEQKQSAEAIVALQKAEQLNPNVPGIYFLLSRAYTAADRKRDALRAMSNVKNLRGEAQQREIDVLLIPR